MIYGNFAKNMNTGGIMSPISESQAVLNALMEEYNAYKDAFVNESYNYLTEREEAVMEAKMQVITEAVSAAIIAAIIAGIGAIIGLIFLIIKLVKKGKDKVAEKTEGKTPDPSNLSEEDKKNLINDIVNSGDNIKLEKFSSVDFSEKINTGAIGTMRDTVKRLMASNDTAAAEKIKAELSQEKIMKMLFKDQYPEGTDIKQKLIDIYNSTDTSDWNTVINNISDTYDKFTKKQEIANGHCTNMAKALRQLEDSCREFQNKFKEYLKKDGLDDKKKEVVNNAIGVLNEVINKPLASLREFISTWRTIEGKRVIALEKIYTLCCNGSSSSEEKAEGENPKENEDNVSLGDSYTFDTDNSVLFW